MIRIIIGLTIVLIFAGPSYAGSLADVLCWKYNCAEGLRTRENPSTGKMEIFDWPAERLGPEPTNAQIRDWTAEFDALPAPLDPDDELAQAIQSATTLQGLKDALLGSSGREGRVRGRKP